MPAHYPQTRSQSRPSSKAAPHRASCAIRRQRGINAARRALGSTWHLDEVFIELEIPPQKRRDKAAAKRFFKRVLAACPGGPHKIVTNHSVASEKQAAAVDGNERCIQECIEYYESVHADP
jgi:transposase-like protein